MKRRMPAVVALTVAAAVSLTACGDDRECLDYDTHLVTTTTIVNGKPTVGTSLVTYCAEYAPEKEAAK